MTPPPDDKGQPKSNSEEDLEKILGAVDPIKWLESLAARQGANPEEFITSADLDIPEVEAGTAVDDPGYIDYDPFGSSASAAEVRSRPAPAPEPTPAASASGEPISGEVNPLAWLESLARRQGANPEEFVTAANLDIPEVAPGAVVNEPGYTPYQAASPAPAAPAPEPVAEVTPPPEGELTPSQAAALLGMDTSEITPVKVKPVAAPPPPPPVAPPAPKPAPAPVSGDPLGGAVDPLAWLESLARRQGANPEELITSADLDVPIPTGMTVDEPGYVDYSPFTGEEAAEAVSPEPAAARPPAPEPMVEALPSAGDTLAWLEGLAAEQGAELPPFAAPEVPAAPPAEETAEWLALQAESLARARMEAEAEAAFVEEDLTPAEPVELPPWLLESMPAGGFAPPEPAPLVEEITAPPQPSGLPDWLSESAAATEDDLLKLLETEPPAAAEPAVPAAEAAYDDPWAVALDEEFKHRQRGEEPEWYHTALEDPNRAAALESALAAEAAEAAEVEEIEEVYEEPAPADLPPWLSGMTVEPEAPAEAVPAADVPDWLADTIPAVPGGAENLLADWLREDESAPAFEAQAEETPDWLSEAAPIEATLPDWLREAAPVQAPPAPELVAEAAPVEEAPPAPPVVEAPPAPRPEPVVAAPVPPVRAPSAPTRMLTPLTPALPTGEAYAPFRTRLQQNPQDHAARLDLARALDRSGDVPACLGQYQALVQHEALLDNVAADLSKLAARHPSSPQVRRVLGDVLMRQGHLQEALDIYRAALEQL